VKSTRDEFDELLGAYALDAVDPLERKRIERHIETCETCASEVARLRAAAAELSVLAGPPVPLPEGFAQRLDLALDTARSRSRGIVRAIAAAVGVAALVVAIAGGYFLSTRSTRELNDLVATGRPVALQAAAGFSGRGTVYVGQGAVAIVLRQIPDQGHSHSYQLWAIRNGTPSSLGVIDRHGTVKTVVRTSGAATYAVTVERAGGAARPTTTPVLESS